MPSALAAQPRCAPPLRPPRLCVLPAPASFPLFAVLFPEHLPCTPPPLCSAPAAPRKTLSSAASCASCWAWWAATRAASTASFSRRCGAPGWRLHPGLAALSVPASQLPSACLRRWALCCCCCPPSSAAGLCHAAAAPLCVRPGCQLPTPFPLQVLIAACLPACPSLQVLRVVESLPLGSDDVHFTRSAHGSFADLLRELAQSADFEVRRRPAAPPPCCARHSAPCLVWRVFPRLMCCAVPRLGRLFVLFCFC
jgi:hypothetical protein